MCWADEWEMKQTQQRVRTQKHTCAQSKKPKAKKKHRVARIGPLSVDSNGFLLLSVCKLCTNKAVCGDWLVTVQKFSKAQSEQKGKSTRKRKTENKRHKLAALLPSSPLKEITPSILPPSNEHGYKPRWRHCIRIHTASPNKTSKLLGWCVRYHNSASIGKKVS